MDVEKRESGDAECKKHHEQTSYQHFPKYNISHTLSNFTSQNQFRFCYKPSQHRLLPPVAFHITGNFYYNSSKEDDVVDARTLRALSLCYGKLVHNLISMLLVAGGSRSSAYDA